MIFGNDSWCAGSTSTAILSVNEPFQNYQWFIDDANVPGATLQSFVIPSNFKPSAGLYTVSVKGSSYVLRERLMIVE